MRRFTAFSALAICVICCAALVPQAVAKEIRYSGKTSQGLPVKLRTDAKGVVTKFVISLTAKCSNGVVLEGKQGFEPPFRRANGEGFLDGGRVTDNEDGIDVKARFHVEGTRVRDDRFKGAFDSKAKYFDNGEQIAGCRSGTINWTVTAN